MGGEPFAVDGVEFYDGGGQCPVQWSGEIDGCPFFFRARGWATLNVWPVGTPVESFGLPPYETPSDLGEPGRGAFDLLAAVEHSRFLDFKEGFRLCVWLLEKWRLTHVEAARLHHRQLQHWVSPPKVRQD